MLHNNIFFYIFSCFYFCSLTASDPLLSQEDRNLFSNPEIPKTLEKSAREYDFLTLLTNAQELLNKGVNGSSSNKSLKQLSNEQKDLLYAVYLTGDIVSRQSCVAFTLPKDNDTCFRKSVHSCYQAQRNVEIYCLTSRWGCDVARDSLNRARLFVNIQSIFSKKNQ